MVTWYDTFMNPAQIGALAGVIAFISVIPYIVSILRKNTKPERTSYLIWCIVDVVGILTYISAGASTTIWTGVVFTLTGLLVLILSIKFGVGGLSKFDLTCLVLALGGIFVWVSTKDAVLALYFVTFVKIIGYLPTIRKSYFYPKTENSLSWTLVAGASILNLFALTSLQPQLVTPILCSAVLQSLVAYLLLFPVRFRHTKKQPHKIHLFLDHPIFAK